MDQSVCIFLPFPLLSFLHPSSVSCDGLGLLRQVGLARDLEWMMQPRWKLADPDRFVPAPREPSRDTVTGRRDVAAYLLLTAITGRVASLM